MKHKEEVRPTTITRDVRPNRVPINGEGNKLTVEGQEPGFHYCWVNDYNIPKYERAGYEYVTHAVTVGDRHVNTATGIGSKVSIPAGNGVSMYLMRILSEYYDEDMKALQKRIDEAEATMFESEANAPGRYGNIGREKQVR